MNGDNQDQPTPTGGGGDDEVTWVTLQDVGVESVGSSREAQRAWGQSRPHQWRLVTLLLSARLDQGTARRLTIHTHHSQCDAHSHTGHRPQHREVVTCPKKTNFGVSSVFFFLSNFSSESAWSVIVVDVKARSNKTVMASLTWAPPPPSDQTRSCWRWAAAVQAPSVVWTTRRCWLRVGSSCHGLTVPSVVGSRDDLIELQGCSRKPVQLVEGPPTGTSSGCLRGCMFGPSRARERESVVRGEDG